MGSLEVSGYRSHPGKSYIFSCLQCGYTVHAYLFATLGEVVENIDDAVVIKDFVSTDLLLPQARKMQLISSAGPGVWDNELRKSSAVDCKTADGYKIASIEGENYSTRIKD